eukprot:1450140-Pyramimonas_sp.AAC.1
MRSGIGTYLELGIKTWDLYARPGCLGRQLRWGALEQQFRGAVFHDPLGGRMHRTGAEKIIAGVTQVGSWSPLHGT